MNGIKDGIRTQGGTTGVIRQIDSSHCPRGKCQESVNQLITLERILGMSPDVHGRNDVLLDIYLKREPEESIDRMSKL